MDYYEEFGVSPSASVEEIRQAHKRLARLLHPDRFQDEELRLVAEIQMKRVNHVFSVLDDRRKRLDYDLAREQGRSELGRAPMLMPAVRRNVAWVVAGIACLVAISWFFSRNGFTASTLPARPAPKPPVLEAADTTKPDAPETQASQQMVSLERYRDLRGRSEKLRRKLKEMERARDASLAEVARLQREMGRQPAPGQVEPVPPVPAELRAPPPPAQVATIRETPSPKGLTGTWFYVPEPGGEGSNNVYAPEYIEAVIAEENGYLQGRYRGRYRVTDRAISPEVAFRFDGKKNAPGRYWWTGRDGARGEVRLKLTTENSLEVAWFASELGAGMGLGSGTSVLIRREDP